MVKLAASSFLILCLLVLLLSSISALRVKDEDKTEYIVYMGSLSSRADNTPMSHHMSILQEVTGERNGGSCVCVPKQDVTTTSWDFMGLKEGTKAKRNPTVESDTIIGVIDSGITPESQSFSDKGFGPPPKKWKGVCSGGKNFTCNNKLIGARDYTNEGTLDTVGHGTHTHGFNRGWKRSKSAASSNCSAESARLCSSTCMEKSQAEGKILVCDALDDRWKVESVGAIAVIFKNQYPDVAALHPLPASGLQAEDFDSLVSYIESTDSPKAAVLKTETIFNRTSPVVASFSSLGPNHIAVDILKPDITAPGMEILAAYSPDAAPSLNDPRRVKYNVLFGTSMSCPHVTGVAAYIKTFYPEWSPSMIQSAIMTTAWPVNAIGKGIASTEFAYRAGHINPIAALNPGLVYKLDKADHIAFLCGMNYTSDILKLISGENITCSENNKTLSRNLNYPSMSAKLYGSDSNFTVTFNRTLTNVGTPSSTYKSTVVGVHGSKLNVEVTPSVLSFKSLNEKQSFRVTDTGNNLDSELPSSANLIWFDGTDNVRSPIVIYDYHF